MFFIFVSLINFIMALYLIFSLVKPLKIKRYWKILGALFILMISQQLWISGLLLNLFAKFNPSSFWFGTWVGFFQVALFVFFVGAVGWDIVYFVMRRVKHPLLFRIPLIVCSAALVTVIGFYEAIKVPSVSYVTIKSTLLPPDWRPVTIALLSDLHIGSNSKMEKQWLIKTIEKTNALNPDMIFVLGDNIDAGVHFLTDQVKPFQDLKAPGGVYFIFGNHETYHGPDQWQMYFNEHKMNLMNDKIVSVNVQNQKINLAGIYKNIHLLDSYQEKTPLLLLTHFPINAKRVPANTVAVQFSGHTHGGQFGLLLRPLIAVMNGGFVKGLYQLGQSQLYVHSGTGLWRGFPFRFMTPSEITLVTLIR